MDRACAMNTSQNLFTMMIAYENLFQCWDNFKRGKHKRKDIQVFERYLEDNIFKLHDDLKTEEYQHQFYEHFYVTDPKQRFISKASVRDRFVHHILHEALFPIFDKHFIYYSLASRPSKGIHFGIESLKKMIRKVSLNGSKGCFGLKMDIRRFFDSVNHDKLKILLRKKIEDNQIFKLVALIIDSFGKDKGIPLGNVTSQLFANVYLNELDNFIKHTLHEKFYLRYCDDFIILSQNEYHLNSLIVPIQNFLNSALYLELHPKKISIRKLSQGIDFIGYVLFQKHTLLRAKTKIRMKSKLKKTQLSFLNGRIDTSTMDQQLQSYLGMLSHANEYTFSTSLKNAYWVR